MRDLADWARAGARRRWWWRWAWTPPRGPGEPAGGQRGRLPGGRPSTRPLGLPTVLVQEGGYDLDTLGELVRDVLTGVEEGLVRR